MERASNPAEARAPAVKKARHPSPKAGVAGEAAARVKAALADAGKARAAASAAAKTDNPKRRT
jgi:hypothetical protein